MTYSRRIRLPFAVLLCAIALSGVLVPTTRAQTPTPTPAATGQSLSEDIAGLSLRAAQLLKALDREVVKHIVEWAVKTAMLLSSLIMIATFMRVWRESEGGGLVMVFLFLRMGLFMSLIAVSSPLISDLAKVGITIAEGDELAGKAGKSLLFEFYAAQRESFNASYQKFTEGQFTVKVDGQDFPVKPGNGTDTFVGVLSDTEANIKDLETKLNDSSWSLPRLFSFLGFARTIIEGGNFWLLGLGGFLLIAAKIAAPFMIVLAIDQKLAHKATYPFMWGVAVLTLAWPAVRYFIQGIAYLIGNFALAIGDNSPLYNWDRAALQAIHNPLAQPVYTVAFAAFFMLIAGGCVWVSPYIAYRVSMGQVYEGVSTTMSGWAGAVVGTVVETYSASAAASISQQAALTQAQGAYEATGVEARANREAGTLRNRAGFITGKASALSAAQSAAGAAMAAGRAGLAQAYTMFGSANKQIVGVNEKMAYAAARQQTASNNNANLLALGNIRSTYGEGTAARDAAASNIRTDADQTYISSAPLAGQLGGGSLAAVSGRDHRLETNQTLQSRMSGITGVRIDNQNIYTDLNNATSRQYAKETAEINREAGDRMAGISMEQAREAAGAAFAAAGTAIRGHSDALGLNNEATGKEYAGRMEAARINFSANKEAARLQALASVVGAVGGKIVRDIERGLELRY